MGDMQDPINLRSNPCYSVTEVPEETEDMNYNYMYEYVENGSESSMSVKTSGHKLTRNTKKRVSLVGCITIIAAASIIFSVIAFALSCWSADKAKFANNNLPITIPENEVQTTLFGSMEPDDIQTRLNQLEEFLSLYSVPECGPGIWERVAYVNMSDSSQQCPSAWREHPTPVRSCGRSLSSTGSCSSTFFGTVHESPYSKVCGRAIGYQYGAPDAFSVFAALNQPATVSVNSIYVDGISVTHRNPRSHIWTFASGNADSSRNRLACPCSNPEASAQSPSFIGDRYFCESGTISDSFVNNRTFYSNDPLWDGEGCVNSECCTFNSPPWFSVPLPSPTTDDIEVRICGDESTNNEDTPIELLEIYVQ